MDDVQVVYDYHPGTACPGKGIEKLEKLLGVEQPYKVRTPDRFQRALIRLAAVMEGTEADDRYAEEWLRTMCPIQHREGLVTYGVS